VSNGLAIRAVTLTLQNLIRSNVDEVNAMSAVTTLPPDKVTTSTDQLNLFLYHVSPAAAWRNMDLPGETRSGEKAPPPLPLTLDYLITAYGPSDHTILGKTMGVLHDTPLLGRDEIKAALSDADLHVQIERVRLTLQPLSLEDMYRLWNGFQTQYRISAAYQASVVLIASQRKRVASLPVLRRGDADQGAQALAGASPFLTAVLPPGAQSAARLGDVLTLQGTNLTTEHVRVRFRHPAIVDPIDVPPAAGERPGELTVTLPAAAAATDAWAPGVYTVSLVVGRPSLPEWSSNELWVGLAPAITRSPATVVAGDTLAVTSTPRIRPDQRVLVMIGHQQVAPSGPPENDADVTKPSVVRCKVPPLERGARVVRLRVDGVDSNPAILAGDPPLPAFDPDQMV